MKCVIPKSRTSKASDDDDDDEDDDADDDDAVIRYVQNRFSSLLFNKFILVKLMYKIIL